MSHCKIQQIFCPGKHKNAIHVHICVVSVLCVCMHVLLYLCTVQHIGILHVVCVCVLTCKLYVVCVSVSLSVCTCLVYICFMFEVCVVYDVFELVKTCAKILCP